MKYESIVPGEKELRSALRKRLLNNQADKSNTVIIEELGLCRGRARIDVAVINGLLHGYEIKSDRDRLSRLEAQVELYGKCLDRATLVVGVRHRADALSILPGWWGVLCACLTDTGLGLKMLRPAQTNPHRDPRSLVELLWRDDAIAFLETRNAARGVRGAPRHVIWDRVCDRFGIDEIASAVQAALKARAMKQDSA